MTSALPSNSPCSLEVHLLSGEARLADQDMLSFASCDRPLTISSWMQSMSSRTGLPHRSVSISTSPSFFCEQTFQGAHPMLDARESHIGDESGDMQHVPSWERNVERLSEIHIARARVSCRQRAPPQSDVSGRSGPAFAAFLAHKVASLSLFHDPAAIARRFCHDGFGNLSFSRHSLPQEEPSAATVRSVKAPETWSYSSDVARGRSFESWQWMPALDDDVMTRRMRCSVHEKDYLQVQLERTPPVHSLTITALQQDPSSDDLRSERPASSGNSAARGSANLSATQSNAVLRAREIPRTLQSLASEVSEQHRCGSSPRPFRLRMANLSFKSNAALLRWQKLTKNMPTCFHYPVHNRKRLQCKYHSSTQMFSFDTSGKHHTASCVS